MLVVGQVVEYKEDLLLLIHPLLMVAEQVIYKNQIMVIIEINLMLNKIQ